MTASTAPAVDLAIERAERFGFLRVRAGHNHQATDRWWKRCTAEDRPYITLVASRSSATVVVDLLTRRTDVAFTNGALVLLLDTARRICTWGPSGTMDYTSQHLSFFRLDPDDAVVLALELVETLKDPNLYEAYRHHAPLLRGGRGTE